MHQYKQLVGLIFQLGTIKPFQKKRAQQDDVIKKKGKKRVAVEPQIKNKDVRFFQY